MNQVNEKQKDGVLKTMAIIGFVAIVIFGVWLAVQIVSLLPSAFSSLASIADGVYNYRGDSEATLNVETDNSVVNAGSSFEIVWDEYAGDGVYTFSYECTDGVSVNVRTQSGTTDVVCGETVTLGGDMNSTVATIASEKTRFADVSYTISFVKQGETDASVSSGNMITVVNPSIPQSGIVASETDSNDDEMDAEITEEPEVVVEEETTPAVSTPVYTGPRYIETITYEVPVSNPNGTVDLAVRIVAVGQLDSDGDFVQRNNIDDDANGAFQFEVKNIGTKTSGEWDFTALLTSGKEYNSPDQAPLKPQERVVFTLGYDNVGDSGIQTIGATVRGGGDTNASNNSFTWAVSVVN